MAELGGNCISIFSPSGEKIRTFGSRGSAQGQFNEPRGVTVDGDGNILVVDRSSHCIQKFKGDGKFLTAVGQQGNKKLEFTPHLELLSITEAERFTFVTGTITESRQ